MNDDLVCVDIGRYKNLWVSRCLTCEPGDDYGYRVYGETRPAEELPLLLASVGRHVVASHGWPRPVRILIGMTP